MSWVMLRFIQRVLNKILHRKYLTGLGSEYTTVSKYSKVLNILRFGIYRGLLRKSYIIYAWQDSKYFSGSEYGRVLNMPRLYKSLKKTLYYRYLIGFWIRLLFLNVRVTESWSFCINCTLEIHSILNMIRFSIYQDF